MTPNAPRSSSIFATRAQVTVAPVRAAEQTGTKLIVVAPAPKAASESVKPQCNHFKRQQGIDP